MFILLRLVARLPICSSRHVARISSGEPLNSIQSHLFLIAILAIPSAISLCVSEDTRNSYLPMFLHPFFAHFDHVPKGSHEVRGLVHPVRNILTIPLQPNFLAVNLWVVAFKHKLLLIDIRIIFVEQRYYGNQDSLHKVN